MTKVSYYKKLIFLIFLLSQLNLKAQQIGLPDKGLVLKPSVITENIFKKDYPQMRNPYGFFEKHIDVFSFNDIDLSYSSSISYNSGGGVEVDDWGGRMGIGWKENVAASITREIRSVVDEKAASRLNADVSELMEEDEQTLLNLQKLNNASLNFGMDGEYDIFRFNIFGESGSFIINGDTVKLLNHNKKFKISLLGTHPYKFLIVDNTGFKYFFGLQNSDVEYISYSDLNQCDQGSQVLSNVDISWYLSRIESPKKRELNFFYTTNSIIYPENYNELVTLILTKDLNMTTVCGAPNLPTEVNASFCLRFKKVTIPLLNSVVSDNFRIEYEYIPRLDIYNEKLLSSAKLFSGTNLVKSAKFFYNLVESSVPLNGKEDINLGVFLNSEEKSDLGKRYFLSDVAFFDKWENIYQKYSFGYNEPVNLPKRFSFSKDLLGFYNGKANGNLIPDHKVRPFIDNYNKSAGTDRLYFFGGDRLADSVKSQYGLLNIIKNPYQGADSIIYELNSSYKLKIDSIYTPFSENSPVGDYEFWGDSFSVPIPQDVKINFEVDYFSDNIPPSESHDLYYIDFGIYDIDNDVFIDILQPGTASTPVFPGGMYARVNILTSKNIKVSLPAGNYQFVYDIIGDKTYGYAETKLAIALDSSVVKDPYFGNRVKEIVTKDKNSQLRRRYCYNLLESLGNKLNIKQNESALVKADYPFAYHTSRRVRDPESCPPGGLPPDSALPAYIEYKVNFFHSNSIASLNIYSGKTFTYQNILEITGDSSITAFRFSLDSDEDGYVLYGDYSPYINLSNRGWRNGLVEEVFYGTIISEDHIELKKSTFFKYSTLDKRVYNNYVGKRLFDIGSVYNDISEELKQYSVYYLPLYSVWYGLEEVTERDYFKDNIVLKKRNYQYDIFSKEVSLEQTQSSDGATITKTYRRPYNMVIDNLDDSFGTYARMVDNNLLSPVIIENHYFENKEIFSRKTDYKEWFPDVFMPLKNRIKDFDKNEYHENEVFLSYDHIYYQLREYRKGDERAVILWSYKGNSPIAVIYNSSWDQIVQNIGIVPIDAIYQLNPTEAQVNSFLQSLKDHPSLSNIHVISYTHEPLVGVTSMTDAKGLTTFYEYDSFQRLKAIKDDTGNILSAYNYHYSNP